MTITNLTHAYDEAARGNGFREEFIPDDAIREMVNAYGDRCDDLHTDLHECLGHGSGRLLPGVSAEALRNYGSTIEERAPTCSDSISWPIRSSWSWAFCPTRRRITHSIIPICSMVC